MRPWWEDGLTDDERRLLDPGPDALDPTPDVLVVGGGVVGLAAAVMCRRAGLGRVQLIERDRIACGPSGSAAGGLTPGVYTIARPGAFAALAAEGLRLHRALDEEWDGALGTRTIDWLVVTPDRIAAEELSVPGVEVVDEAGAREIEPGLGDIAGALAIREQSWVQPQRLAAAFASRAGSVASGVAMTGIETHGGKVVRVRTTSGDLTPGAFVLATGAVDATISNVPQRSVKGHLLVTAPVPHPPKVAVASSMLVMPLPDGRLLAGGTFDHDDDETVVRDDVIARIRDELARVLPGTAGVAVERAWCCFRPGTPDELPVIDRIDGVENGWMSVGHYRTGLLVAPGAGETIASWISTGRRPDDLTAFASSRFV